MFKSLYYTSDQIINCFPEINDRLITEYEKNKFVKYLAFLYFFDCKIG